MHAETVDRLQTALQILEHAPVVILALDLEGRIQHMNPFFERLTGYRLDEVRGRLWFDTFLPERDRERIRAVFAGSTLGEHVRRHVNPIVTRTGEERQIEWTDESLLNSQGSATGILAIGQDVTEREATEIRHRSVIAAMHDGVVVQAPSGAIVDCNPAAERMLGLSAEQMTGRTSLDPRWRCIREDGTPFPGDEHPAMVTLATGAPSTEVVMGVHHPDGRLVWISINSAPLLRRHDNAIIGAVTSFSDITERKRAEATLQSTERRLAMVLDNITDGFFALDWEWRFTDINPAGARMVGHTVEELLGRVYLEAFPAAAGTIWERTYRHSMETGEPATAEEYYEPLDQWFEASVFPFAGGISVFFRDISSRKRAERSLHKERERLHEAQRIAKMGSWELDLVTNSLVWSDEIFNIFEIETTRFGASYEAFLAAIHPDDRTSVNAAYQASVASGTPYEVVHRLLMPDGRLKWVQERGKTDYDAAGRALCSVGTVQDISAQVEAEHRLRNIVDGMFAFVGLFDLEGTVLEANRAPLELAGLQREDVTGKPLWDAFWWSHARETQDQVRMALARAAGGEIVRDDFVVRISGGRLITIDAMFGPLRDASGRIEAVIGSAVDITARRNAEDAARRSAELLRTVISGAPVVIFALDTQGIVTFSEGRTLDKLDLRPGEMVGASALELYGGVPDFEKTFRRVLLGETATLVATLGSLTLETAYAPSYDAGGVIDGVIGVGFDVSERVAAEGVIRDREARLALIFNNASDAMLLLSVNVGGALRIAAANQSFADLVSRMTKASEDDLVGLTFEEIALDFFKRPPEVVTRFAEALRRVIDTRAPLTFEYTGTYPTGPVIAEVTLVPVLDCAGACVQILWTSRDVTAKRQADAQVRASLREKETLLREIHHRVKNNLQIIAGLLHFQGKKLRAPEDADAFAELRQRIVAMTLLHERLYQSPDVANVVFCDYVRALVADQVRTFAPREGIRIDVTTTNDVLLPIEIAMPGGMIVSELVTNVLKYAFPETRVGTATVSVRLDGDRVVLGVDDEGVGFPDGFDLGTERSFGWELVRTLVLQLGGTVEATTDRGAHVRVSFPLPAAEEGLHA